MKPMRGPSGPRLPAVRRLRPADVADVMRVQAACYGTDLLEDAALYARRLSHPAHRSLGLRAASGHLLAYLAAYGSVQGQITPLHGEFAQHPAPDTLYLHDLAVRPDCAGQGLAQALLHVASARAAENGLKHMALVSVQDTNAFWRRQGFAAAESPPGLDSYGAGAVYMVRMSWLDPFQGCAHE
jgi:ribosomal protein S18 acetylase RimI-like enzyme